MPFRGSDSLVANNLPKHIAIIMDGNGRWAKQRQQSRIAGHKAGLASVREVIETCAEENIEALSLFAFSSENWNRPVTEVRALMELFYKTLQREIADLHTKRVVIKFIGNRERLPTRLQKLMRSSEALTVANTGLKLVIAIDYGGVWDIIQACKAIADDVEQGKLSAQAIDEAILRNHLATHGLPDPDLFIRTSGEQRISNFYLMQLVYTELYFYDGFWPDFRRQELMQAIEWFQSRERRYGATSEQMRQAKCLESD